MNDLLKKLLIIFSDIKLQHTVFALPFAIISAFLAAEGFPETEKLMWILLAMVTARSSAMSFNRIVDARFDAENPRTKGRALPAGKIGTGPYIIFLVGSSLIFIFASAMLNQLAFYLSPIALAIVFFYSLSKRFTAYSHFWLGLAISVAPVGAWVAIREEISLLSLILGTTVVFWLVGFDIIYACLDVESDTKNKLNSIPQKFGIGRALWFAKGAHIIMILLLLLLSVTPMLGGLYLLAVAMVAALLWYEHSLVNQRDLSKVNIAFFNVNGWISLSLMGLVIVDCVWI